MQRNCKCEHNRRIRLTFSDGSSQEFELKQDNGLQTLMLQKPVATTAVTIKVLSQWSKVNNGANEIIFFASSGPATGTYMAAGCKIAKCSNAKPGQYYTGAAANGKSTCPIASCKTKPKAGQKYSSGCTLVSCPNKPKAGQKYSSGCTLVSSFPASKIKVTSCSASSEYSGSYRCQAAFNGVHKDGGGHSWATRGQGVGSWIKANFAKKYTLTKFQYMQRNCKCEHNRRIRLTFSDGSSQEFELKQDNGLQTLTLQKTVATTSVTIKVLSQWSKVNNGANEIIFYGTTGTPCPSVCKSGSLMKVKSCSASSAPPGGYTCANAFNGIQR